MRVGALYVRHRGTHVLRRRHATMRRHVRRFRELRSVRECLYGRSHMRGRHVSLPRECPDDLFRDVRGHGEQRVELRRVREGVPRRVRYWFVRERDCDLRG